MSIRAAGQSPRSPWCTRANVVLGALSLFAIIGCDIREQKPKVASFDFMIAAPLPCAALHGCAFNGTLPRQLDQFHIHATAHSR